MTPLTDAAANRAVYVRGLGAWLPQERVTVEKAVASGAYGRDKADKDGFSSVAVESTLFPADMGLRASRQALDGVDPAEVDLLAWTSIHRHGHKTLWPPASFLHRELGLPSRALAFGLNQGCNGEFVAMRLAIEHLCHDIGQSALIAGADRFEDTLFDRWESDHGTVYGDAASAVVLSNHPGPLRVLSLDVEQGSDLESMYRDDRPSPESEGAARQDYDVGAAKRAYIATHGTNEIKTVFADTLARLRAKLLAVRPLDRQPAQYVIYPNVGAGMSAEFYEQEFSHLAEKNMWGFGRTIGHTGVSDQIIGLINLLNQGALTSGDHVLLIGAGNGLSVAAMLLEMR